MSLAVWSLHPPDIMPPNRQQCKTNKKNSWDCPVISDLTTRVEKYQRRGGGK